MGLGQPKLDSQSHLIPASIRLDVLDLVIYLDTNVFENLEQVGHHQSELGTVHCAAAKLQSFAKNTDNSHTPRVVSERHLRYHIV